MLHFYSFVLTTTTSLLASFQKLRRKYKGASAAHHSHRRLILIIWVGNALINHLTLHEDHPLLAGFEMNFRFANFIFQKLATYKNLTIILTSSLRVETPNKA